MKATFRIPTKEYAYIELNEVEVSDMNDANEKYQELERTISGGEGLSPQDWNTALDRYLTDNNLSEDQYANMSKIQQYVIQEIKKCVKRINK